MIKDLTTLFSDPLAKRHGRILLGLGAVVGIMLGAVGAFDPVPTASDTLPASAIARVNDSFISTEDLRDAIAQEINANKVSAAEQARVLNRLIDKELLVQNAVEAGLIASEQSVREAIFDAMVRKIITESESNPPSDRDLREFFEDQYGSHNGFLFEQVREQVVSAYKRSLADKALREYIDWLWEEANISISGNLQKSIIDNDPGEYSRQSAAER